MQIEKKMEIAYLAKERLRECDANQNLSSHPRNIGALAFILNNSGVPKKTR